MTDELPTECEAFVAVVNAVLDGDAPATDLASAHPQTCRDCRELASAARLLATAGPALRLPPMMSADLRPRLIAVTSPVRRPRRWVPALAACVAIGGGVVLMWPSRPAPVAVGAGGAAGAPPRSRPPRPPRRGSAPTASRTSGRPSRRWPGPPRSRPRLRPGD